MPYVLNILSDIHSDIFYSTLYLAFHLSDIYSDTLPFDLMLYCAMSGTLPDLLSGILSDSI